VSSLHHNYANPCIDFLADFDLNIMFINWQSRFFLNQVFFCYSSLTMNSRNLLKR